MSHPINGVVLPHGSKSLYESSTDWLVNDDRKIFLVAAIDKPLIIQPFANEVFTNIPTGLFIPIPTNAFVHVRPIQTIRGMFDGEFPLIDRSNKDLFVFPTPIIDENKNCEMNLYLKNIGKSVIEINPNRVLAVLEFLFPVENVLWKFRHSDNNPLQVSSFEKLPETNSSQILSFGLPLQIDTFKKQSSLKKQSSFQKTTQSLNFTQKYSLPLQTNTFQKPSNDVKPICSVKPTQSTHFEKPLQSIFNPTSNTFQNQQFSFDREPLTINFKTNYPKDIAVHSGQLRKTNTNFETMFSLGKKLSLEQSSQNIDVTPTSLFGQSRQTINFKERGSQINSPSSYNFPSGLTTLNVTQSFEKQPGQKFLTNYTQPSQNNRIDQNSFKIFNLNKSSSSLFGTPNEKLTNGNSKWQKIDNSLHNFERATQTFPFSPLDKKEVSKDNTKELVETSQLEDSKEDFTFVLNHVIDPGDTVNVTFLPNAAAIENFQLEWFSAKFVKNSYIDLFSNIQVSVDPLKKVVIPTGICVDFSSRQMLLEVWNVETAVEKFISVIDEGQPMKNKNEEILVYLINHGIQPISISRGDKIAKLVAFEIPMDIEKSVNLE